MQHSKIYRLFQQFDTIDLLIFMSNFVAFLLQIRMPEAESSIMAFLIFWIILWVLFFETYSVYGWNKSSVFIAGKCFFYCLAVVILLFKWWNQYVFTWLNISMLIISIFWIMIRNYLRHLETEQRTSLLISIQLIASLPWDIVFLYAAYTYPEHYGIYSLLYRTINIIGYLVAIYWTYTRKEPRSWYLFSWFGLTLCLIYCAFIIIF